MSTPTADGIPIRAAPVEAETAREHLAAIIASSDDAILSKDPTGRILSWNPGAERIYGYAPEEAIGRPISILIPPHRAGEEGRILSRVLTGERVDHYETERMTKDGRQIVVSLTVSPIRATSGEIVAASVIARDITSVHRSRELAQQLQDVTAALSRELSETAVIDATLKHAIEAFGAAAGTVAFVEGAEIAIARSIGHRPEGLESWMRFPLTADTPMSHAIRTGRPVWVSRPEELTDRFTALRTARIQFAALAVLPLISGGSPFGAVSLTFSEPHAFEAEESTFLNAAIQHAADALTRARSYEAQRLAAERESFLADAGELLAQSLDPEQTLNQLADLVVHHIADWCCIEMVDESRLLRNVAVAHAEPELLTIAKQLRANYPPDPDGDMGIHNVIRTGTSELYREVPDELLAERAQSSEHLRLLHELGIGSAMIVPLRARNRVFGAITLVASAPERQYDESDVRLAEDLARRAALAVDNAMHFRREHQAALTLQRSLLPQSLPTLPGLEFHACYHPATAELEVGGDWYEVVAREDGTIGMTIADVAGRGIGAASVMGRIRPALRAYVLDGHQPKQAVERLDRLLREFNTPQMATVFHLQYDPAVAVARYVRAGHPPALLRHPSGDVIELWGEGAPPLGILDDPVVVEREVEIPPGSLLLLFTDGLIERREIDLGEGLKRLGRALAQAPSGAVDCLAWLQRRVRTDAIPDDVAMLAMSVRAPDGAAQGSETGSERPSGRPATGAAQDSGSVALRGPASSSRDTSDGTPDRTQQGAP